MSRRFSVALAAALALSAVACGEPEVEAPVIEEAVTQKQSVSVVPTFSLTGHHTLPADLYLSELGFTVSEIRLEPLAADASSVAYSAVQPEIVRFDVSRGETIKHGQPIVLPEPGRYLVSLRLEPLKAPGRDELISSFTLLGFVAQSSMRVDPRYEDDRGDRPTPHPFDEGGDSDPPGHGELVDSPEAPDAWTPFRYHSERAVFFTLNTVDFQAGEQALEFSFDMRNWVVDIVEPISRAVETDESLSGSHQEGVDISRYLDSNGQGAEAFIAGGSAQARTRGGF